MKSFTYTTQSSQIIKNKKVFNEDGEQEGRDWTSRDPVRSCYCNGLMKNHLHIPFLSLCFGKKRKEKGSEEITFGKLSTSNREL